MNKYDAIIVLATQPDPKTWRFPQQLYECLDKATQLFKHQVAPYIITSGDRALSLDYRGITQPFRECDKMKEILVSNGIPQNQVLVEGDSRDTISNLYFLKEELLIPKKATNLLFVVASFRIPRLTFLCQKILGPGYTVTFEPIEAPQGDTYNEQHTLQVQSLFLESMKDGDHHWLDGRFFDGWMYQYWKERSAQKYTTNKQ
jgi:uncharacterized SAM-binding protein YcdF (DUF218 family)